MHHEEEEEEEYMNNRRGGRRGEDQHYERLNCNSTCAHTIYVQVKQP